MSVASVPGREPGFDTSRCFVRIRELRDDGYVRFDFAIGDPELAVELALPLPGFQAFCRDSGATHLTPEQAETVDFERSKWQFGIPGIEQ